MKRIYRVFLILILLVLVLVGSGIVFFRSQMQSYVSLNAGNKIAQVCAYLTPASPPQMYVHVILYDNDGNKIFDYHNLVSGNQVQLQGDIVRYWSGLDPLLQSGYKLTYLQGSYTDANIERSYKPDPIPLNGGDDNLYKVVHALPAGTPIVQAIYDKPLILAADGRTHDIILSQDGLSNPQVNGPLACGLTPQSRS